MPSRTRARCRAHARGLALRGLRVAALLSAHFGVGACLEAEAEEQALALRADEACAGGGGPDGEPPDAADCGLGLLQLRAAQSSPQSQTSPAAAAAGAGAGSARRRRGSQASSSALGASPQGPQPTAAELKTLPPAPKWWADVVDFLWQIDAPYRLQVGSGYRLNHQARAASVASHRDTSPSALFSFVNQRELNKGPCTSNFLALLDNYKRETDKAETVTSQGRQEESAFMQCLMKTPHMRYIYKVLVSWGTIKPDYAAFSKKVSDIWLTEYSLKSRGPQVSSGFEHVFVGEEKMDRRTHRPTIVGMHNWIQFWREEKAGRMDYLGYVGSLSAGGDRLVSVRFAWEDDDPQVETKSVSTFLVGTSVPFELAMLTGAFLGFGGEAKVPGIYFGDVGPVQLTAYAWKARGRQVVRTAFLEG